MLNFEVLNDQTHDPFTEKLALALGFCPRVFAVHRSSTPVGELAGNKPAFRNERAFRFEVAWEVLNNS